MFEILTFHLWITLDPTKTCMFHSLSIQYWNCLVLVAVVLCSSTQTVRRRLPVSKHWNCIRRPGRCVPFDTTAYRISQPWIYSASTRWFETNSTVAGGLGCHSCDSMWTKSLCLLRSSVDYSVVFECRFWSWCATNYVDVRWCQMNRPRSRLQYIYCIHEDSVLLRASRFAALDREEREQTKIS